MIIIIIVVVGSLGTVPKNMEKNLKELKIRGRIETIQTTVLQKSARIPGDLRRLAVTQTPVKDQFKLV